MTTWAVTMVKDEADVIAGTLRHLAYEHIAGIIVADNASTDGTREILDGLDLGTCELVIVDDPDIAYHQSAKMSYLARLACERGATWIVPFDADEVWYADDRIGLVLEHHVPDTYDVAQVALYNHFATSIDPDGRDPFQTIQWRQPQPGALPKVAFRARPDAIIHQGNHGVSFENGDFPVALSGALKIRHFPARSADQFVRKAKNGAAAYAATEFPPGEGAHWRQYGDIIARHGEEALRDVFREHFWYRAPVESGLILDPAPYLRWA